MSEQIDEWIIGSRPRPYDDIHMFRVWLDCGAVRLARRCGNDGPMTPGQMIFLDCSHPIQNVICDESRIRAWRISA